jgi:hypothetical protein
MYKLPRHMGGLAGFLIDEIERIVLEAKEKALT